MRLCVLAVLVLAGVVLAVVLLSAAVWFCGGEVGSPEGGAPDAVVIVLGFAQVQGEGIIQEAESGQGLLQAVDGAGGGLEIVVQVGGGGVVGSAFGQQPPLFALAAPVEQVSPGQDELVAVVARFQGQAPPSTTGWKVQNPPSAGVLRRDRSIARAWACSRVSGAASPARS